MALRYALVWTKTIDIYREMIKEEGWTDKDTVEVPIIQTLTFKVRPWYSP